MATSPEVVEARRRLAAILAAASKGTRSVTTFEGASVIGGRDGLLAASQLIATDLRAMLVDDVRVAEGLTLVETAERFNIGRSMASWLLGIAKANRARYRSRLDPEDFASTRSEVGAHLDGEAS